MEEINVKICTLKSPANFVISGCTGSGKTYFLLKLLKEWPFQQEKNKMIYFYNIWQPLFEEFLKSFPEMQFIQGLNLNFIDDWVNEPNKVNVCIVDDLADLAVKNDTFARLFTVYGHHKNILNFFITQNPFFKGPLSTTINRNTHYFVLTKTPHLNVMDILNNQLYGSGGPLKQAYMKAMNDKEYNYLLVDVFADAVQNRLRSCIFSNESPMIIWRSL